MSNFMVLRRAKIDFKVNWQSWFQLYPTGYLIDTNNFYNIFILQRSYNQYYIVNEKALNT